MAQEFKSYGDMLKETTLKTIPLDVSTRWNSVYIMLEAANQE